METSVCPLFAQVASWLSTLFASLSSQSAQGNGTALQSAPENAAASTSTSLNATGQVLSIKRNPSLETTDAHFGAMAFDGKYIGVTMERKAVAIPLGTYPAHKRDSAHFGMRVVGIDVPNRTDIECHPANLPSQLEGCIAVGESKDGDALDNSRMAFDVMMETVPEEFTVQVS